MIEINDKSLCSGCSACEMKCPKNCINMSVDKEGFWYPLVDKTLCIDCGLCEKVCPISNSNLNVPEESSEQYAAYSNDLSVRKQSSSGGIFSAIASAFIEEGGIVIGAAYDADFKVKHVSIDKISDLSKLRGSKYVQSDIGTVIKDINKLLEEGIRVLFSGTPCQVNGVLNSIPTKYHKLLFTIDFVCHGVPSPKIYNKFIEERKRYGQIINVNLRDKRLGWKTFSVSVEYLNAPSYHKILTFDYYIRMLRYNISLRPSCYKCNQYHRADITLADYWTIAKDSPDMYSEDGVSQVWVNTENGCSMWEKLSSCITSKMIKKVSSASIRQCGHKEPEERKPYFENIDKYGYSELFERYCKKGCISELMIFLKGWIKIVAHYLHIAV